MRLAAEPHRNRKALMTRFAVKNPVTVLVLAFILLLAGFVSYQGMPRESSPEIKIPLIFVTTIYAGASPEDMEKLVTEKIEDKLEGLDGLKKVSSTSGQGFSSVTVEFNPDVVVETALRRVKDKVDEAKPDLPTDAEDPTVQELNFSNIPIFVISMSAEYESERLDAAAEDLKDRIKAIPGVLEAQLTGKQAREVAIDADPSKLRQYGLSLNDIVKAVQTQHRNIPGGTLLAGGNRFTIQLTGELAHPEDFAELVVRSQGSTLVRVRDVATVRFGYSRDQSTIFRLNGRNSIAISVTKRTGANIIKVVDEAKEAVKTAQAKWPKGTSVDYTFDQSVQIRHMVNELQNHIIMGLILVVGVISFFLGFRNSFFISTAIPFSMMMGFLILDSAGITLNMVVLFSLVIALGMLVDDGIVVVENIYRHLQMGKDKITAAIDGTREVMIPVATATITTVVAFLPILFMPGIMGQFMKYLPVTVTVTLMGSLFVAFVFNPVFASLFMKIRAGDKHEGGEFFDKVKSVYRRILNVTVDHPIWVALGCVLFVVLGMVAYGVLGTGAVFFPSIEPKVVAAEITGPIGISNQATDSALKTIEARLFQIPKDKANVESFSSVVGFGKVDMAGGDRRPESHLAYIDVTFVDYDKRSVTSWTSMQWMQDELPKILPGWKVAVKKQQEGPPQGHPVEYEITGEDFETLAKIGQQVKDRLLRVPNLVNVNWDYDPVQPELGITIDRDQAKAMGVSTMDVALAVRGSIHGIEAAKFRVGKDEHDVMVRLNPETRESFSGLDQIVIPREGDLIPLTSVATIVQKGSLSAIKHIDGARTIQVWGELAPGVQNEQAVKAAAAAAIKDIETPPGYRLGTGSGNREQEESQAFLVKAFLIAVALVVLTIVAQFNSIAQPFLIFIGILLSLGGVFWGLLFVHVTFSILMTGIGIIALAGVVAKNGIVLIDFINKLREEGTPLREAVIEGGATRLRPVILTAITAMIGLLPMATGMGFDFVHMELVTKSETSMWWAPMAWGIFWGLFFNTGLTLVVVPTFYYAWEMFKLRIRRWFGKEAKAV